MDNRLIFLYTDKFVQANLDPNLNFNSPSGVLLFWERELGAN